MVALSLMLGSVLVIEACDFSFHSSQTDYPDRDSRSFLVYRQNCSGCHVPPLPDAHPAVEWPGVLARMQQHRMESRMLAITAQDLRTIRDYLVAHAAVE